MEVDRLNGERGKFPKGKDDPKGKVEKEKVNLSLRARPPTQVTTLLSKSRF